MTARGVLLIGVDETSAEAVCAAAGACGLGVRASAGLGEGLRSLGEGGWLATFLSLQLEGAELELAERVAAEKGAGALVLLASRPTVQLTMEAVRRGAREVMEVPLAAARVEKLLAGLSGSAEGRIPLPEVVDGGGDAVGSSPQLLEVFKVVARVAPSAATVLVTGESGTGKELVARAIHEASERARGPFVPVNCAAIPEDLLESELFGHERGAFTGAVARKIGRFERASGGTLFLDEIGDMSLVLQAKILRALQEREIERLGGEERIRVDVRVVAATHRDLAALIDAEEFREDLFYRLAVVRLHLSALREREGDMRELALHYSAHFAAEYARPVGYLAESALARLAEHDWPGNVRELRNVLERAVLVATSDTLRADDIQIDRSRGARQTGETLPGYSPKLSMAELEKLHIARVLEAAGGHLGRAAEILGMHRNTVSRKAQEYGLASDGSR
ncbi:MAG: sigma-54 dependent transcriptional regulator [Gemmatimonadetes bacterium]|nr:sigma-54 dependent transcriptional regulator [Gemmatimonadota bacterium]